MEFSSLLKDSNLSATLLEDRAAYIQAVRQGISGRLVESLVRASGERELLIRLLSTSSANLSRYYRDRPLTQAQSEGVLDLLKVMKSAQEVFGSERLAKEWLHTKILALGDYCPIELCDTFEGRKLVLETLQAIEYGEFV